MYPLSISHPKPLQALLGGTGIALSTHSLLVCNGAVLGVSGFVHRAVKGDKEASLAVLGMVLSGVAASVFGNQASVLTVGSFPRVILGGLLVGVGTKLANGCTSGHMIAGLSRFSKRSFVATMTFFPTAVLTTQVLHRSDLPAVAQADWSLQSRLGDVYILAGSLATLATLWTISKVSGGTSTQPVSSPGSTKVHLRESPLHCVSEGFREPPRVLNEDSGCTGPPLHSTVYSQPSPARFAASFLTAFSFGVSLHLANMVDPYKVLGFLILPFTPSFDPSLAFLAISALPITAVLYHFARGTERPRFGGKWAVPTSTTIDARLIGGAILFGIGWGIGGICPGPALVNLGHSLYEAEGILNVVSWVASMVVGGLIVSDVCPVMVRAVMRFFNRGK